MLDETKLIYGPYNLIIDDGTSDDDGTLGTNGDTDAVYDYKRTGLKKDSVAISETVEKEELEDGVERELTRKLEIVFTFSEVAEADIASIQNYGDGSSNHVMVHFNTANREIVVLDTSSSPLKFIAEVEDGKMKITISKTTSNVNNSLFTTNEDASVTASDYEETYTP